MIALLLAACADGPGRHYPTVEVALWVEEPEPVVDATLTATAWADDQAVVEVSVELVGLDAPFAMAREEDGRWTTTLPSGLLLGAADDRGTVEVVATGATWLGRTGTSEPLRFSVEAPPEEEPATPP